MKNYLKVDLVQHVGSDEMVANAARVSTDSDNKGKSIEGLIKYLARSKHLSVFEHNSITFMVSAPLFVRDQWVRHRTQSYNILSFRYTDQESDHPMELFYFPDENRPLVNSGTKAHPKFDKAPTKYELACANDILHDAYADAYSSYLDLLEQGVASEIARAVLPSGTMTRFYATANLRNWYQFCKERLAENAQYEIRVCAEQVDKILAELFPISWPALFADSDTTD